MDKNVQLQYRYLKITDEQFATFEENYDPTASVEFQNSVSFSFNYAQNVLTCSETITYLQNEKIILKLGLNSIFLIHPDSVAALEEDGVVCCPKELLWQFASLNYGTMRGVLYDRTKNLELNTLVLPPFFFDSLIKDDIKFARSE